MAKDKLRYGYEFITCPICKSKTFDYYFYRSTRIWFGIIRILGCISQNNKSVLFVEWMFRMKNVYAGWYNDKILLRVKHQNGIDDYSLQGFVRSIKNELEIKISQTEANQYIFISTLQMMIKHMLQ